MMKRKLSLQIVHESLTMLPQIRSIPDLRLHCISRVSNKRGIFHPVSHGLT